MIYDTSKVLMNKTKRKNKYQISPKTSPRHQPHKKLSPCAFINQNHRQKIKNR